LNEESEPPDLVSFLERKLTNLSALYSRFGREGLRDQPISDVNLLLASKELQFRDAAKGRDLGEEQKAANRRLEIELLDLRAYVKSQLAGSNLGELRSFRQSDWPQQQDQQRHFKPKDRGMER
jgi:hypothetical protein